jgi:hypothetical protein
VSRYNEAQDLNPVTMAIARGLQIPVVTVGDPHQHIYSMAYL